MLRRLGVPLFDADAEVHRLLAPGGEAVARGRGGVSRGARRGRRDRPAAARPARVRRSGGAAAARSDPAPAGARRPRRRFVAQARARREKLVVLDIPLLFETGAPERVRLCARRLGAGAAAARAGHAPARHDRAAASRASCGRRCRTARSAGGPISSCRPRSGTGVTLPAPASRSSGRLRQGEWPRRQSRGKTMREIVIDTETTGLDPE